MPQTPGLKRNFHDLNLTINAKFSDAWSSSTIICGLPRMLGVEAVARW